jgi:superkiller protein 3
MGTLLAVTVVKVGAWRDDLSLWKASAAAHPDSTEIRLNLIAALAQAGDVQGADAVLRETAAGLPEDPHLAYLGGWLAQLGGEPAEALRQYERALSLGVGLARAFRDAALVAAQLHQWDRACHLFQAAAERSPRTAWPEVGLGWCRQRERRLDLAQAHFHRAARLEPASPERPAFLGQLLLAEGRRPEALSAFQAALALDPAHVPAHRAMALLLEQEGRVAEAMERWQSVAASLPPSYRGEALQHLRQLRATPARTASPAPQQDEPPSVPKPGGPGDRFGPR